MAAPPTTAAVFPDRCRHVAGPAASSSSSSGVSASIGTNCFVFLERAATGKVIIPGGTVLPSAPWRAGDGDGVASSASSPCELSSDEDGGDADGVRGVGGA